MNFWALFLAICSIQECAFGLINTFMSIFFITSFYNASIIDILLD